MKKILIILTLLVCAFLTSVYISKNSEKNDSDSNTYAISKSNNAGNGDSKKNTPNATEIIGHDARRQTNMSGLKTALMLALTDKEISLIDTSSCQDCSSDKGSTNLNGTGWVKFKILPGKKGIEKYFPEKNLYVDPINSGEYVYRFASNGKTFEIDMVLAHENNQKKMSSDNGNNPTRFEAGSNLILLD